MSTEVGQPITVVSPRTGEVIALDAPTGELGQWLADVREAESMLKEAKNLVQRELVRRMDKEAKWTQHVPGGLKLSAPSPKPEEIWDGVDLRGALMEFVDCGVLAIEAVDAAVEQKIEYDVHKRGLNSLRNLGGEVGAAIEKLKTESEKQRYVSVGRS